MFLLVSIYNCVYTDIYIDGHTSLLILSPPLHHLQNNASLLLLAIMESRRDSENAERILYNMSPIQLVEVAKQAYYQEALDDNQAVDPTLDPTGADDTASSSTGGDLSLTSVNDSEINDSIVEGGKEKALPRDVGHNIYILAHQVCTHHYY